MDSPFEKVELHQKFIIQCIIETWGSSQKEEIMTMCRKDEMDIRVPRSDDGDRIMGPPIIELEFEYDTLDSHIIIGGENIQLRMKREKPTLCERCF